jgi:hypothetical protein
MFGFLQSCRTPPSLKQLPLKPFRVNLSLNRLIPGVDNIRIDVHLSPQLHNTLKKTASLLMIKHSRTGHYFQDYRKESCEDEKNTLRNLCKSILMDGINKAKSDAEVQIDLLGQAAVAKLFLEETGRQYGKLIANIEELVRTYGLFPNFDPMELFKLKEKLAEVKYNRTMILLHVGEELLHVVNDVQADCLKNIRKSIFHPEDILPDAFFLNPVFHTDNPADDYFLSEAYVLLGLRSEDPDTYKNLKSIIYDLLGRTDLGDRNAGDGDRGDHKEGKREGVSGADGNPLDSWIMDIDNIDRLFNYFGSREQFRINKDGKESRDTPAELESRIKIQEALLDLFHRQFKESRLMKLTVAAYAMKPIYRAYCPPLKPRQVREFIADPGSRKSLVRQMKSRESLSLSPLYETIGRINDSSVQAEKEDLLGFLRHFFRYHRDLNNFRILKGAMDAINLVNDEKTLILSRENRLLYEFLLPDEQTMEDKPIISHAIIKADIRGSVSITSMMRERGLNPASYFSLNFFDPISEILSDYNASKEFIEGDAIILSIFEHEATPQGWYSVARASGLAIRMLHIVHQYNLKSRKHNLPILEFGIGICFDQSPPTFLFDGNSKIIISPAINLADRLSSCNRTLRRRLKDHDRVFNLFVFQDFPEGAVEATADDVFLRYNVNGIELSAEAFTKLAGEINLKSMMYTTDNHEKVKLYTGTFPTLTGRYERLVIREAGILEVKPETFDVIGKTSGTYYEVCTHPEIYAFIKNNA